MKNKVLKVAIVMMLIIAMTISDFILVGAGIVHALENQENLTNHENVKFATYFKTEDGKKLSQAEYQMDNSQMKLCMQVSVENEGYFDGVITLKDSNFKFKQEKLSEEIKEIDGNTIYLNTVRAENTIEIEVGIEPVIEENYEQNTLNKESLLSLTGTYKDSTEKDISIEAEKEVALSLLVPSTLETSLEGNVITNKTYKIGETNKRLVQIELNSTVLNNAYPVKATTFEVALPVGVENVGVISKGTYATNGEADQILKTSSYEFDKQNSLLKIALENPSKNGKISWKKDAKDSIIVTLVLDEKAEVSETEYSVKAEIQFQGTEQKTIAKEIKYNLKEEADGIIRASIENKEEIFKGKIYSKEEREYKTTTNIEVNYANLVDVSTIQEKTSYRVEKETENINANIEYKTTTINKAEIEKILGEKGSLTIKDTSGNELAKITKDTVADESGNVVIIYNSGIKELQVEITKAILTGIIRLNHTKVIKAESYSRDEMKEIKYLVEEASVKYETTEYEFTARKQLGETQTVAQLEVDKQILSTVAVNEQVKIAVTLKTDSEQYDLYKNPTLTIKLPEGIKNVSNIKTVLLHLNYSTEPPVYNPETREIKINLYGEQEKYNVNNANGYIEILADIELEETVPSRQDEITLTYTNEKAISYNNEGKSTIPVTISGFGGLLAFNHITNYSVKTNSVNSKEEQIGNLKMYQDSTEANFQIALVNNTGSKLENVIAVGNLPLQGEAKVGDYTFNNTIDAKLKSEINIETGNATIYYTANKNATTDLNNVTNGWSANLDEVANPILYMVVISNMEKGTSFIANYTMRIPANLEYNKDMKTTYVVDYSSEFSNSVIKAIPVGLETGKVFVTLEAKVGMEKLENNATVKAGEVIKYIATVTNTGSSEAKNVKVNGLVPKGTVYIEPVEEFEHASEIYYKETETSEVNKELGNCRWRKCKICI